MIDGRRRSSVLEEDFDIESSKLRRTYQANTSFVVQDFSFTVQAKGSKKRIVDGVSRAEHRTLGRGRMYAGKLLSRRNTYKRILIETNRNTVKHKQSRIIRRCARPQLDEENNDNKRI